MELGGCNGEGNGNDTTLSLRKKMKEIAMKNEYGIWKIGNISGRERIFYFVKIS